MHDAPPPSIRYLDTDAQSGVLEVGGVEFKTWNLEAAVPGFPCPALRLSQNPAAIKRGPRDGTRKPATCCLDDAVSPTRSSAVVGFHSGHKAVS